MRVLFVNAYRQRGGATIAARRIADAVGPHVDVEWLVMEDLVGEPDTHALLSGRSATRATLAFEQARSQWRLRPETLFSTGMLDRRVLEAVEAIDPDIVHLHWPHAGMLGNRFLSKVQVPTVWTMHDQYLVTGGCHYTGSCDQWRTTGCDACPILPKWNHRMARNGFAGRPSPDAIVSPSRWLADAAAERGFTPRGGIHQIPNPVPLDVFRPLPKEECRAAFGMPDGQIILLAGALGWHQDRRKGMDVLHDALEQVSRQDMTLHTFGGDGATRQIGDIPVIDHGHVPEEELVRLYNACDAFVLPSREENYANTANEATACGAPLIASDVGGNRDFFEQGAEGVRFSVGNSAMLAEALLSLQWRSNSVPELETSTLIREPARVGRAYRGVYGVVANA